MEEKKGETRERTYTYEELRSLQSKLALVAGDKQKENRATISHFESVRTVGY